MGVKVNQRRKSTWKHIPLYNYNKICRNLTVFKSSCQSKECKGFLPLFPQFYKLLLLIWLDSSLANSIQMLWNNKLIPYRNNVVYIRRWAKKGITFISDVVDINGNTDSNTIFSVMDDSVLTRY